MIYTPEFLEAHPKIELQVKNWVHGWKDKIEFTGDRSRWAESEVKACVERILREEGSCICKITFVSFYDPTEASQ